MGSQLLLLSFFALHFLTYVRTVPPEHLLMTDSNLVSFLLGKAALYRLTIKLTASVVYVKVDYPCGKFQSYSSVAS